MDLMGMQWGSTEKLCRGSALLVTPPGGCLISISAQLRAGNYDFQ